MAVHRSETPVLVSFFAPYSRMSGLFASVLDDIVDRHEGSVRMCRVNAESEAALAGRYGVSEVPTVILFKNGRPAGRFSGIRREEEIKTMLAEILL